MHEVLPALIGITIFYGGFAYGGWLLGRSKGLGGIGAITGAAFPGIGHLVIWLIPGKTEDTQGPPEWQLPKPSNDTRDVHARLETLDKLLLRGIITAEEHQEQRQRILDEL